MNHKLVASPHQADVVRGVILVVDDDGDLLDIVVHLLQAVGHNAVSCSTPAVVLEKLHEHRVCLVVSDISMPDMSGFALLRRIHERRPDIPVVLMTGEQGDADLAAMAIEFGAYALLYKPFDAELLWATTHGALGHGRCSLCN